MGASVSWVLRTVDLTKQWSITVEIVNNAFTIYRKEQEKDLKIVSALLPWLGLEVEKRAKRTKWLNFWSHIEGFSPLPRNSQMNSLLIPRFASSKSYWVIKKEWHYLSLIKWFKISHEYRQDSFSKYLTYKRNEHFTYLQLPFKVVSLCLKARCLMTSKWANKKLSLHKYFFDTFRAFWKQLLKQRAVGLDNLSSEPSFCSHKH